jgi:glycosyltransferase involved in cell wall biosynthesis
VKYTYPQVTGGSLLANQHTYDKRGFRELLKNVKILLLNQDWFATELRDMGHEVVVCGIGDHMEVRLASTMYHIDHILGEFLNGFAPDVMVWLDNSAPLLIIGLEHCGIPMIFYSVDTQHHHELHSLLAHAFDYVLIAQRDYMVHFAETDTPMEWFPLWAPRHVEASKEKKYGLTFVGNVNAKLNPGRVKFFEELQKLTPIHIQQGAYWEVFPLAEIMVNQTVKGDLNFRVFEAMMCGPLLLTEKTSNGLLDLFTDGEHLVTYERGNAQAAADIANNLLCDPARRNRIAEAGRTEVLAKHTAQHRAIELDKIIKNLRKRTPSPHRYFSMMINHHLVSSSSEQDARGLSVKAIIAGLRCAQCALDEGAEPTDVETAHLIRACVRYDRLLGTGAGAELLKVYAEAFPHNYLLGLAEVRSRLNQGKRSEATELAARISSDPSSKIFALAESAISMLLN